jgi:crotonobetainyl-CoA:carnitine CoA-transferase CaiB-like acyl-CoA transferase
MSEDYLFAGLKVLDVGSWIAGPVAATILADYGADVIKIEIPGDGQQHPRRPMLTLTTCGRWTVETSAVWR